MATFNGKNTQLRQVLKACPIRVCDDTEFIPVTGHATHKVFSFEVNLEKFILKVIDKELFTQLNRPAIFNGQKVLYELGVAPEPIWFDALNGIWIERFVTAEFNQFNEKNKFHYLGRSLAHLHTMKIDLEGFPFLNLPAQWESYLSHLPTASRDEWQEKVSQANCDYNDFFDSKARVLCHNDLSFCHILNFDKPLLIDWEYAAIGSRYFDLVSALSINKVPRHKYLEVCKGYESVSGESVEDIAQGILQMKFCSKITNGLWYEAKSALPL